MSNLSLENEISQLELLQQRNIELKSLLSVFKNLTDIMKNDFLRSKLTADHWSSIEKVSDVSQKILNKGNLSDEELDFLAQLLRFLRNACAGSTSNLQCVLNSSNIICCARKILCSFKQRTGEKELIVLKCCLQLFGNLVCTSINAKSLVWNICLEENIFKSLFEHKDHTVQEYAMMVLYNCMSDEAAKYIITSVDGQHILAAVLDSLCVDVIDWGILFLEYILKHEDFMKLRYEALPLQSRLLILDVIIEQLSNESENSHCMLPISSITYIKELYIEYVMNIVQICSAEPVDMQPAEIIKILGLLCAASVSDAYSHILKSSQEILEMSLDTLKSVHLLGKQSTNAFSAVSNLKVTNQMTKDEIECNPSYGFKKNLIRLIGNLCYNCRQNQDMVRKLDGISLLLDCCNLDARNPFIMQWCILAIRNILEKNEENKAFLASVSISGDLVDSALIKELGFEVHNENGKFNLRSIHIQKPT